MSVGRNDPCPCGSGKKYKQCHLRADEGAVRPFAHLSLVPSNDSVPARRPLMPPTGEIGDGWALTIVPAPVTFDDDPQARPVVVLVTAGTFVMHVELLGRAPAELEPLAAEVLRVLDIAIANAGKAPHSVALEYDRLARTLRPTLRQRAITVRVAARAPAADDALVALLRHLAPGAPPRALMASHVQRWAAWGWPDDVTQRLHAAAAAFYRAAPWTVLANEQPVAVRLSAAKAPAYGIVMGAAGELYGLALYEEMADIIALFRASEPGDVPPLRKLVMTLSFDAADDVPTAMRREVRSQGWEVAGLAAWPTLMAYGSPGGGITVADAERLIVALEEIPAFVARHRAALAHSATAGFPISERGVRRGTRVDYRGDVSAWEPPLWTIPRALAPCGATGPSAAPGASLARMSVLEAEAHVAALLDRYVAAGAPTSRRETRSQRELRQAAASALLHYQVHVESVTPAGFTELHLRRFLYEVLPLTWPAEPKDELLSAVINVLSVQAAEARVTYPWARALLADLASCRARWQDCPAPEEQDALNRWSEQLEIDLELRLLVPYADAQARVYWQGFSADATGVLYRSLVAAWLGWRDALIVGGVTDGDLLEPLLHTRQLAWFEAPQEALGGRTPAQVLLAPVPKPPRRTRRGR